MDYAPNTDEQLQEMLQAVGVASFEELLRALPAEFHQRTLDVPAGLTEPQVLELCEALAARNRSLKEVVSFLGAGAYHHLIPTAVDAVASRGEWLTPYTPYQAEASQGTLQAIYEWQTMVSELTGLPAANASLYDGASALAEAANAACRHTGRRRIVLPHALHPHYKRTVRTYFGSHPECEVAEAPSRPDGTTDLEAASALAPEAACVVVQSPNFFGVIEDLEAAAKAAHAGGALCVAVCDPVALGVLRSPGECGADIAVGEAQGLGLPLSYGGPYAGYYAAAAELLRTVPGRICGRTADREGRRAFVLTLQAREQHIRREKASSNVCTNQALLALAATIHLSLLGPKGLEEVCDLSWANAHRLAELLSGIGGCRLRFPAPFFQEFVLDLPADARAVRTALLKQGILAGYPLGSDFPGLERSLLICATETRTPDELEAYAAALDEALGGRR
jgi:glycine dehydrogenase subunit 1